MLAAVRGDRAPSEPTAGASADLLAVLRDRGACFRSELAARHRAADAEVDEGLWDLVARGIVTADAFSAVRSLLSARLERAGRRRAAVAAPAGRRSVGNGPRSGPASVRVAGPSCPTPTSPGPARTAGPAAEELAEAVAWQLLARWGVVAWELWARESYRIPWRDVVRALRRLEARGQALGGRFVAGISGEQYAPPEAASLLAEVRATRPGGRRRGGRGRSPQPDGPPAGRPRVPSLVRHRTVRYVDGVPHGPVVPPSVD